LISSYSANSFAKKIITPVLRNDKMRLSAEKGYFCDLIKKKSDE